MQPTISIPHGWDYPRFTFGQRTKQGIIVGMVYYQIGTYLAEEFGEGWYYTVSPNKHSEELHHYLENELTLLSPEELQARIQAEIDCYRQQIKTLTQQLSIVTGGRNNAQVC
ncbi:hypothetical protein [aff. Roholtiella sp. LEGE 12411]|uniref:hypothetical protein n=1 Tax=aff. Roholtiella sp. LEGE 12411 TaxID=1828822 RepID=UPI00187F0525|nr:hypothetical protein [aff. Roholtiella sp. LEGE 12411]MBE9038764.1 hypothetical protein [aff. Roholtiella sp. LEGE 12411]